MTDRDQKAAAKRFADKWLGKEGYEKGETQQFWNDLLRDVFGIDRVTEYIEYEKRITLANGAKGFIDGYISSVPVLIEQKGSHIDIRKPEKQSDGTMLDPHAQAKRYVQWLGVSKRPKYIVVCNFREFLIYDEEDPAAEPQSLMLEDLPDEYHRLRFLINDTRARIEREKKLSLDAGRIVRKLYDALLGQYKDPDSEETYHHLNMLCVRLVFCMYAEDSGVFDKDQFSIYMRRWPVDDMHNKLRELFKVLDMTPQQREEYDEYMDKGLAAFAYVNGGLFAENIKIPFFNDEIAEILLDEACPFNWDEISPTIFGAIFEATLDPKMRRHGGMHYTSLENIHKVIDPLFLNDLTEELNGIFANKSITKAETRIQKLEEYRNKLAKLTFFDPACGSGNFLTETYICLRELENRILRYEYISGQQILKDVDPIMVRIQQFFGIEIHDYAVDVARTALWIAEAKMMRETEEVIERSIEFLPLKNNANIIEGNALRIDWETVVPKDSRLKIFGNPPFLGYSLQNNEQKDDILSVYVDEKGKPYKTAGKIDYVAAWYFKAAEFMQGTDIRTAFVSTNSITQGEQVAAVWKPLYDRFGVHIDFAYRTFKWDNRGHDEKGNKKKSDEYMAIVHVVIVGFSTADNKADRIIFDSENKNIVKNINPYLVDAPTIFVESRTKAISDVPTMQNGGKPTEGGFLILSEKEKDELLCAEPLAEKYIRPYMMGNDFIQRKPRYCLWLVNANPSELRKCKKVLERVEQVKKYRLESQKEATRKKAETPTLFDEVRECLTDYVAIPKVSSEKRKYIPIEYLSSDIIPGDKLFMLQNISIYHFGVLTSSVHMNWMRAVCGRLKSDYSYSNTIVYNNFPWPSPTPEQRSKIEQTAQAILDARALYPDCSLADLYDETTMPPDLRKAHQANDKAVMQAYGFRQDMTESEIVAELMRMYQELTR